MKRVQDAALVESRLEHCTNQQRDSKRFKGEIMKKQYAKILLTVTCLLGIGVTAEAGGRAEIVMTLTHGFVVRGKTLPAGTYTVTRISDDASAGVVISSYENRTAVVVLPGEVKSTPANKPSVSLERVGDVYFLSKIETPYYVYAIPVPRSAIMEAAARLHEGTSAQESSGNN